jgi:hypothetical protein
MPRKKTDVEPPTDPSPPPVETPSPGEAPTNGHQEKRQPVAKFKCASGKDTYIEVAVWENAVTYQDGTAGTQLSTSFSRSYKNGEGWKTNYSFRQHDLPILLYLLQKAHGWMLEQRVVSDVPF